MTRTEAIALPVGARVRWNGLAPDLGTVVSNDGTRVVVRWDNPVPGFPLSYYSVNNMQDVSEEEAR